MEDDLGFKAAAAAIRENKESTARKRKEFVRELNRSIVTAAQHQLSRIREPVPFNIDVDAVAGMFSKELPDVDVTCERASGGLMFVVSW